MALENRFSSIHLITWTFRFEDLTNSGKDEDQNSRSKDFCEQVIPENW